MGDLRSSVTVDLLGNIPRRARTFGRAIGRFARGGRRQLRLLESASIGAGRGLDRVGNRFTALAAGAAGIGTARNLIRLERRFTRLGIQADLSAPGVERLKNQIFAISQAGDIRIDPGQLTAAVERVVEKTGDLGLAEENLRNMALTIQATGAAGSDVGALIADMQQKFGLRDKDEFLKTLDGLVTQGKAGAFELGNLATQGERVTAAFAATGRTGPVALREMGAILQMARRTTGGAEEATTAFERLLATITIDKIGELQEKGIQLFEPEALARGVKQFRAIPDIIKEIIRATGGDTELLGKTFDIRAMRALNAFAIEFKQTGGFKSFDEFLQVQGDGSQIMQDSARAANDAAGATENMATAWNRFSDRNLTGFIQGTADALNSIDQETFDRIAKGVIGIGAAALILPRAFRAIGALRGARGGRGGGLGGAAGGATPVFVTNLGAGGFGGGGLDMEGSRRGRGRRGRIGRTLGRAGRLAGRAFVPVTAGLAALDTVSALTNEDLTARQRGGAIGGAAGGFGGALAGAKLGALAGTAVFPGVGTAVGAAGGGLIGYLFGEEIGRKLGQMAAGEISGGDAALAGAGPGRGMNGRVVIELGNAPPGTRVRDIQGEGVDLDVETGISMVGGA